MGCATPSNAPRPPAAHPTRGKPSRVWHYRDKDSKLLFSVFRFDPPGKRKVFTPLTLWMVDGRLSWQWKHAPAPRPLYGLPSLAACDADLPVLIVEGEKCADAADEIFFNHVCMTSCGGASAESKTDWEPLANREIVIWGDAADKTEAGATYAQKVASILHGLGCNVSIIDSEALARSGRLRQRHTTLSCGDPNLVLPPMFEKPTKGEALAAIVLLDALLDEFPWSDGEKLQESVDRSVALSLLMTAVIRAAVDVAPMHACKAPAYGSGKSFLVDMAAAIAMGMPCPVTTVGRDEAETEKRLDSALLKCQPIISLDNVNAELCSNNLAAAVSQQLVEIRVFGTQTNITVENRVCIFATGCNISVKADMVRRTLICTIDADDERPERRVFKRNPYAEILANRGKYIAAIMTISRAYLLAGEPSVDCLRLNSFGAWSRFVQKPLVWLGRADPVKSVDASAEADPERAALLEVLVPWSKTLGDRAVTVDALSNAIDEVESAADNAPYANPELRAALMSIARDRKFGRDTIDKRRLGAWLKKYAGRVVDGLKLVNAGPGHRGLIKWKVGKRA